MYQRMKADQNMEGEVELNEKIESYLVENRKIKNLFEFEEQQALLQKLPATLR